MMAMASCHEVDRQAGKVRAAGGEPVCGECAASAAASARQLLDTSKHALHSISKKANPLQEQSDGSNCWP